MKINVAHWIERSSVNGPGERFVLWVQGCPLKCPGCWNPDTWDFKPKLLFEPMELISLVRSVKEIEGLTLTGGEPFAQAKALLPLVQTLKDDGLSMMVFTGYRLPELNSPDELKLLELMDIVVAGPFVQSLKSDNLVWRGSSNQDIVFLSERYNLRDLEAAADRPFEFHIDEEGQVVVTGFPIDSW